jgi:protein-tyrosine phosphatase
MVPNISLLKNTYQANAAIHIMMVCLGNICRSPMAAAVLQGKVERFGLKNIEVSSSGTAHWHIGGGANPPSQRTWEKAGYKYSHRASQVDFQRISDSDLILVMDSSNFTAVSELAHQSDLEKIQYLRAFDPMATDLDVPDPYGKSDAAFEEVLAMIERATDGLLKALGVAASSDTSR